MARANKKLKTKLMCQQCGTSRCSVAFMAINTEQKDKEKNVYPFKLRRFLQLIKSPEMVKLPKFYCSTCSVCGTLTYFKGQHRGTKLEVVTT